MENFATDIIYTEWRKDITPLEGWHVEFTVKQLLTEF